MLDAEGFEEAAQLMIGLYGHGAVAEAHERLESFRIADDEEAISQWIGIITAIKRRLSDAPALTGEW